LLGQTSTIWEEMKEFVLSLTAGAHKAKPGAKSRGVTFTAGGKPVLLLLNVPEVDVLTLLMERERRKNVLSSEWKTAANTARKKMVSDTKMIL
jgi:hypothetical protein